MIAYRQPCFFQPYQKVKAWRPWRAKIIITFIFILGASLFLRGIWVGAKPYLAQKLLSSAWVQSQSTGQLIRPWPRLDASPIAEISVPRLKTRDIILNKDSGQALAFAPALTLPNHLPGDPGLSLISAHKNTHFGFLKDLKLGDEILVKRLDGQQLEFRVTGAEIIHKDVATYPQLDHPHIALITCYPFDALSYGGPMRYVVFAQKL